MKRKRVARKNRTMPFSDQEWQAARDLADSAGMSISQYIRYILKRETEKQQSTGGNNGSE